MRPSQGRERGSIPPSRSMENKTGKPIISVCVRLVIIKNSKILLTFTERNNFYYYTGGHLEYGESLIDACKREMKEETGANFKFKKILYIRDFTDEKNLEQAVEFFILGDTNKFTEINNLLDPESTVKGFNSWQRWVNLSELPNIDIRPKALTKILISDFRSNFQGGIKYLRIL